jgi:hypothetical protein
MFNLATWKLKLIAMGAVILAFLGALFKARQSGKEAVKNEQAGNTIKAVSKKQKATIRVDNADAIERKRLRKKWTR